MMRFATLLFLISCSLLTARDNPFAPVPSVPVPETAAAVSETQIVSESEVKVPVKNDDTSSASEQKAQNGSEIVNFQQVRFVLSAKEVRIESKDKIIKHFAIKKPTRIILDFAGNADFPTRKQGISLSPFKEIRLGTHEKYYRAVIELKRPAEYTIKPFKYGYILTLK
jgi:hypothetical protein